MNENRTARVLIALLIVGGIVFAVSNHNSDSSTLPSHTSYSASTDDDDSDSSPGLEFHGYECTQDCSGHEAGYAWAEEHDITDEDDCGGNSESFIEGCKAYAQEQAGTDSTDADDDSDPDEE